MQLAQKENVKYYNGYNTQCDSLDKTRKCVYFEFKKIFEITNAISAGR